MSPAGNTDVSGRANILVVDLPEKLLALQNILDELGHNLVTAHSEAEALHQVLQHEFAVILLDADMPEVDGMETAALIRQYKTSAHTPIVFITAHADEMQAAQDYLLGAFDYILTPIVPDVLRSKVRVFVDLYQMQQRTRLMAEERIALARAEAARNAAEETTRRSNFLARAGRELGASLDVEQGMRRLVELVVPQLAELAIVLLDTETERRRHLFMRSIYDGQGANTTAVESLNDLPDAAARTMRQALAEGQPVEAEWTSANGDRFSTSGPAWPARFALALPLRTGERTFGVLLLATQACPQPFSARDLLMLKELAIRAAMALDNAMLYRNLQCEIERSRQAEEKLQDANRRKDEFLAMLSHELRNPLAPIRTAVEVMRRIALPEPMLAQARDVMERQVAHLARLVDELLDVSRISQGKILLRKEPVELAEVIRHGIETERSLIEMRGQRLEVDLPEAAVRLSGDFARLAQVLSNVLNNAAKYTQEGGRIEVWATASEGEAVIRVKDNGSGIDPRLLPKVFELFVQGERSLDRRQGGLGVGLTLVQRIVELHEGRVEVSSDGPGMGTQVMITLPCVRAVHAHEPQVSAAAVPSCRGRRVLVADDNADAAESIASYLELEGHVVKIVLDGESVLAAAHAFLPEVVVLDIGLPTVDGYELARRLRQREETRDVLLIAVTGYGQKEDRERAYAAGFDSHFLKPADPRELQSVIEGGRPVMEPALKTC